MRPTVVNCSMPGCSETATCKTAAPWSGGGFRELKTYGFACPDHTETLLEAARQRAASMRLAPDESLGAVAQFPLAV